MIINYFLILRKYHIKSIVDMIATINKVNEFKLITETRKNVIKKAITVKAITI